MSDLRPRGTISDQFASIERMLYQLLQGQAEIAREQTRIARALVDAESINPDRLYGRKDAARLLSVSVKTIDRWVRRGLIIENRRGRRVYITGRSLVARRELVVTGTVRVLRI